MPADLIDLLAGARSSPVPLGRFDHDGIRWRATEAGTSAVRGFSGWQDLASNPAFHPLRKGSKRVVLRGSLPGGPDVVVKSSRTTSLHLHLLHWVGPTREGREWSHHLDAAHQGLPVVEALALGHRHRFGTPVEGFLVTEYWPHDATLGALDRASLAPTLRSLGAVVARMHAAGLLHGDLHPDNVLVRGARPAEAGQLRIVDWKHVVRRRKPGEDALAEQLAKIVWQFRAASVFRGGGDAAEAAFFEGYFANRDLPALREGIDRAVARAGARRADRAETRCVETNSTFLQEEGPGWRRITRRDHRPRLPASLLAAEGPEGLPEKAEAEIAGEPPLRARRIEGTEPGDTLAPWRAANREHALGNAPLPLAWLERSEGGGWLISLAE